MGHAGSVPPLLRVKVAPPTARGAAVLTLRKEGGDEGTRGEESRGRPQPQSEREPPEPTRALKPTRGAKRSKGPAGAGGSHVSP